jgi:iron complex transport system substrate-binding protein
MEKGVPMKFLLVAIVLVGSIDAAAHTAITVRDDDGHLVTLQQPAKRIVALAPHVTELLFAAGAGEHIVGTVSYNDYPEAAKQIPRIGDNRLLDIERIVALHPDLLVVWRHSNSERQVEQLRKLGIPLFYSQPHYLPEIPHSIERLGKLAGTASEADAAAGEWRRQLSALANRYAKAATLRVFYQVWDKPLYTLNGQHIVSDAIRLCGGENIFADLKLTAPTVGIEAVLQADPEAIVGTAERSVGGGISMWKAYPNLTAVHRDNLMTIDGNLLNRPGPRMLAGTVQLCERLEQARQHRQPYP